MGCSSIRCICCLLSVVCGLLDYYPPGFSLRPLGFSLDSAWPGSKVGRHSVCVTLLGNIIASTILFLFILFLFILFLFILFTFYFEFALDFDLYNLADLLIWLFLWLSNCLLAVLLALFRHSFSPLFFATLLCHSIISTNGNLPSNYTPIKLYSHLAVS